MASEDISRIEMLLREHFAQTDKQIAEIRTEVKAIRNDVEHLKRDVGFLHDWNLWLLMAAVTVLALPKIVECVKSLFGAIVDGLTAIVRVFRREDRA
ncbi:MAG: hypothetical protein II877_07820 [Synergistaceae bacterium]|nr:hypothetical protein [Synergistaceae bacterium]MBQ7169978.1 hypothetical protein [Synergistaceae bacterium]